MNKELEEAIECVRNNMKIIYGKNGKGNISPRISLKVRELEKLGITQEEPEVSVKYTENYILIRKGRERMQVVKECLEEMKKSNMKEEDKKYLENYIRKSIPVDYIILKLEHREILDRTLLNEMINELKHFFN